MQLLSSSSSSSEDVNLAAVTRGTGEGSGVPVGDALVRFVNAVLKPSEGDLEAARHALLAEVGGGGVVDAAAAIANFTIANRIVDAHGIPLDAVMEVTTRRLQKEIGVDAYATAAHTPTGGFLSRLLSWPAGWLLPRLTAWLGHRR